MVLAGTVLLYCDKQSARHTSTSTYAQSSTNHSRGESLACVVPTAARHICGNERGDASPGMYVEFVVNQKIQPHSLTHVHVTHPFQHSCDKCTACDLQRPLYALPPHLKARRLEAREGDEEESEDAAGEFPGVCASMSA